ncbi:hypothetical protein OU994_11870 [Pseudoduganella sp. SL102]|uniref:hypothetical protein n=1 Tax=Pseudoduganella sp. SL102 TaxID=2995154 RepID=UPI00248CD3A0|nr:hypothetical protein [Pseudoduganella sp. SL102]WBS04916.1 hypothetical protein OU994_11870 [Pseudoduganella sp. SL102]
MITWLVTRLVPGDRRLAGELVTFLSKCAGGVHHAETSLHCVRYLLSTTKFMYFIMYFNVSGTAIHQVPPNQADKDRQCD